MPYLSEGEDDFEYEAAGASFDCETLKGVGRLILDALKGLGATALRVKYDGGYDEGFIYPDYVVINSVKIPAETVIDYLAKSDLGGRIKALPVEEWGIRFGGEEGSERWVTNAFDEFVYELAWKLLGKGFGNGDGSLYGAFRVDLSSGEIEDDENAGMPEEGRF